MSTRILVLMLFSIVGCKAQEPIQFPEQTSESKSAPESVLKVDSEFGLSTPDAVEFIEGEQGEFEISAWVPEPAIPNITVESLPKGAVFDSVTRKFTWTPEFDAANDPVNPSAVLHYYTVFFQVSSDLHPKISPLRKTVILIVKDKARRTEISLSSSQYVMKEGTEFVQVIRISNLDFPNGPFIFSAKGLPRGATIEHNETHSVFTIRWIPWYDFVSDRDSSSSECRGLSQKKISIVYSSLNLRSQSFQFPAVQWIVCNNIEQGGEIQ